MAEVSVKCFLVPIKGVNMELVDNFHLPNQEEITIGRGTQFGIKDLYCSKKQVILEANTCDKILKICCVGRNPSFLAGFPMEPNIVYTGRNGMILQITPDIEFMIKFEDQVSKISDNVFERSQNVPNEDSVTRKFKWFVSPSGSLLFCQSSDVTCSTVCKVAGFDLDGTLICTKSGHIFPNSVDDWKLWHPCIKMQLEEFLKKGYDLVIFTNQAQLGTLTKLKKDLFKKKIENIINELNLPFTTLIAMDRDIYRKPLPGMWEYFESQLPCKLDSESSFYVGDAAGRVAISPKHNRSKDFEITDRLFARNVGIKFYTPEEFFLKETPRKYVDVTFHPHELPTDIYPELNIPSSSSEVIVMVGSPASGKSYFIETALVPAGYIRVSRDELKLWTKCREEILKAISRKRNVVYDATNPDKESRKSVLDYCFGQNISNIRCFIMTTSEERCIHNNKFRAIVGNSNVVPYTALVSFNKRFEEPTIDEGFTSIVKVPFVPKFVSPEHEQIYKKYMFGRKK